MHVSRVDSKKRFPVQRSRRSSCQSKTFHRVKLRLLQRDRLSVPTCQVAAGVKIRTGRKHRQGAATGYFTRCKGMDRGHNRGG